MTTPTYKIQDEKTGVLLMIAPMSVIRQVFDLRHDAIWRVTGELERETFSTIHFNGRSTKVATSGAITIEEVR